MNERIITILMATYNGSLHIDNQILSLQQQKYKNWLLYVHDDGSIDNTREIIRTWEERDSRIKLIDDGITGLGPGKNFLSIIRYVDSDYAIFCDQDDIWLENKLSDMLNFAESKNMADDSEPSIIYADGYAFSDKSGNIDFTGISNNHADSLKDFLFFNGGYQGCSIMFNKAMANFMSNYNGYIHLHDDIISLAAHALGKVNFLPKKLMLYRQHSKAVTGYKNFKRNFFEKISSNVNFLLSKKHYLVKKTFFENYSALMTEEIQKEFEIFIQFSECESKLKQGLILIKHDFRLNNSKLKLLLKFLVRRTFG